MKRLIITALSLAGLAVPVIVFAQDGVGAVQLLERHFFPAVVAGVVLAVAFQLLLTNFSAAIGLSAARMFTREKRKDRGEIREEIRERSEKYSREEHEKKESKGPREMTDEVHSTLQTISRGYGIMTLVTASIALFFASWLAVEISGATSFIFAVVVALVIWGVSYIVSLTLELAAGTSMIGGLAKVAKQTIQSISDTTSQLLGRSEAKKEGDRAREITQAVRTELFGKSDIKRQLHDFVQSIKPDFGPRDFRNELEGLLNQLHVESYVSPHGGPGGIQEVVNEIRTSGSPMNKDRARDASRKLYDVISRARQEYQSDRAPSDKMMMGAMRSVGMSPEEAEDSRKKIEGFLRSTDKQELDPDGIKRDLERLFEDPREGSEALRKRLSAIDRDTIETILAKRQDMSRDEVHQKVDRIWNMIENITGTARQKTESFRGSAAGISGAARQRSGSTRERAIDKVEDYLETIDRPALDPEGVRQDLELLFHDPKAGAEELYDRLKHLDREDVMAIVTTNRYISREHAEKLVDGIMNTRDRAMEQAERAKQEIQYRLEQARQETLHQVNQLRKTLASATWWIFGTAVVSGCFAVLGSWIAFFIV